MNIRTNPSYPILQRRAVRRNAFAGFVRMPAVVIVLTLLALSLALGAMAGPGSDSPGRLAAAKKMITVPAGLYLPFLKRQINKPITVKGFRMDETPVTNAEFLEFVKAHPEWQKSRVNPLFADPNYLSHWKGDLEIGPGKYNNPNASVVNVSWFAARAYAKWAGKRLPTVPEWERAGNGKPKNLGNKTLIGYILDWYGKPNPAELPPIRSTFQNEYGLWDMHGLVWEWVFDFNSFVSSGDSRGGTGDEAKLFCAAGSLGVQNKEDYAGYLRFSYRGSLKGKYCIPNLGFRCVKDL